MIPYEASRQQVVDAARRLVDRGLLVATGGNVSVRLPGGAGLAITPSNLDYLRMQPEDVCVLGPRLERLAGDLAPSLESSMHAAVYRARPDVRAIVHTHAPYASTLALIREPIPPLFDEQVRFLGRSVDIVPYGPSGTWLLRLNVAVAVRTGANAYILANHGALCLGEDLERAGNNAELLEKCALTWLLALCTERKVSRIPFYVREVALSKLRADQARSAHKEST